MEREASMGLWEGGERYRMVKGQLKGSAFRLGLFLDKR